MSTHPNVILMVIFKPDGLSRKTHRDILKSNGIDDPDKEIKIGDYEYNTIVMEEDYDEGNQISATEGDIVFYELVTYGYGDSVDWDVLEKNKLELQYWSKRMCIEHNCSYKIKVSANYW